MLFAPFRDFNAAKQDLKNFLLNELSLLFFNCKKITQSRDTCNHLKPFFGSLKRDLKEIKNAILFLFYFIGVHLNRPMSINLKIRLII